MAIRRETVYLRATILKKSQHYDLLKKKPTSLDPNQFCIILPIEIDEEEWFGRLYRLKDEAIHPKPPVPKVSSSGMQIFIDKNTPDKILDRLTGQ